MINLELKQMNDLCFNLIMLDSELAEMFNNYTTNNCANSNLDFNYKNEELEKYILEKLSYLKSNKLLGKYENYSLSNYSQLSSLLEYICKIKYLSNKQEILRKETFSRLTELSGYEFCDGRVLKLEVNNQYHFCKCFFTNVICYDEKRKNKHEDVEVNNILLQFNNVTDVKFNGTIRPDDSDISKILDWFVCKTSDTSYCFSLLCAAGYEKCMLDIMFSTVLSARFN